MQTWSKRHYYSGKEKKPQERWNCLGGIIHRMLAKPNLDFIQSSLRSSVLLVTVCYAKLRETCLFHFFLQFFLCSFWTCAFLTENVFPTYLFILSCSSMAAAVYRPLLHCLFHLEYRILSPALLRQSTVSTKPGVEEASSLFPAYAETSPICPSHM